MPDKTPTRSVTDRAHTTNESPAAARPHTTGWLRKAVKDGTRWIASMTTTLGKFDVLSRA
jgi:hypothetical protein